MAMSRSIGGRSFTTRSPMRTSPEVMSSSPATIRRVVVLPQPDGPTSTTNSLSRMCRFTSFTAWTSSYILFRSLIRTWAMWALPLDAAGHAGHVLLDEERIHDCDRDRADQGAGHQRAPEEHVAADQLRDHADRHGLLLGRGQENQCVDELVPRQRKGEDPGLEDARDGDREDDVDHGLP